MSKLYYMQFNPKDWIGDTRKISHAARGVWIDIICFAWVEPERGVYVRSFEAFKQEHNLSQENAEAVLKELQTVADVTLANGSVTLISRRIVREEKKRELTRNRVSRYRSNASVTPLKRNSNKEKLDVRSKTLEVRDKKKATTTARPAAASAPPKPYLKPDPEKDPLGALICIYKVLRGYSWDDRSWDKIHQPRARAAAKLLFEEICGKNIKLAHDCMVSLAARFKSKALDWNFQTLVKHGHDWVKETRSAKENTYDTHNRQGLPVANAHQRTAGRSEGLRKIDAGGSVLASIRNLPTVSAPAQDKNRGPDRGDGESGPEILGDHDRPQGEGTEG